MNITVKMPLCDSPRLIDIRVAEGDVISLGDILFSYESDGALFFEYSACEGTVTEVNAIGDRELRSGDTVLTVAGVSPKRDSEMFPNSDTWKKRG